jgi:hypothetical protein
MGGDLAHGKVTAVTGTGQAPYFPLVIVAVEDEVSVFILAVGIARNVMLEMETPTAAIHERTEKKKKKGNASGERFSHPGETP